MKKLIGLGRRLDFALVLGAVSFLAGCGAPGQTGDTSREETSDDSVVGEVAQPFGSSTLTNPPVAAIVRVENGIENLWAFACRELSGSKRMMRNVKANYRNQPNNPWLGWSLVTTSHDCTLHTSPTVGKFAGETPRETVVVYWKNTADDLIEVRFNPTGGLTTTNVSGILSLGQIAGQPVIVQTNNTLGAPLRSVSIAVVQKATNKLFSMDSKAGSWTKRQVRRSGGTQAIAGAGDKQAVAAYSAVPGAGFPQPMFSQLVNETGTSVIFSRGSWLADFVEYAKVVDPGNSTYCSKLALGGNASLSDECGTRGCAMVQRCSDGRMLAASLDNTGDISSKLTRLGMFAGNPTSKNTLYSVTDGGNASGLGVMIGNGSFGAALLLGVDYATYASFSIGPTTLFGAPTLANSALRQIFYVGKNEEDSKEHIYHIDAQDFAFAPVDLGLLHP
jgi:hypothetical protein